MTFREVLGAIDREMEYHYGTGDYAPLGMLMQDELTRIREALLLAAEREEAQLVLPLPQA